jgi:serine/threonine protein kinase
VERGTVAGQAVWLLTPLDADRPGQAPAVDVFRERVLRWSDVPEHPHLLTVRGHGTDPSPWLTTDHADHPTLPAVSDQYSTTDLLGLLKQASAALEHAHDHGVVYENLTPNSVVVPEAGTVRLLGAGDGVWAETVSWYTAPEQLDGTATERTLVYRLGAVAAHVLTGAVPFEAYPTADPAAGVAQAPSFTAAQREALWPGLVTVLERALAHDPADRYASVGAVRDAIDEMLD